VLRAAWRRPADTLHAEGIPMASHGRFHWNELRTRDIERAKRFYGETIGWTFQPMAAGDVDQPRFKGVPESWIPYLAVYDVDARVEAAVAAGATLVMPIFEVPDVGRIAMLREPGGAGIGWMTPA
jgi:predicted enzyme related to lactoylglutathione lyase